MEFIKSKKGRIIIAAAGAVVIALIIIIILLLSGTEKGYRSISISELFGNVLAENNGNEYAAYQDMKLYDGYALTTSQESYSRLVLDGDKYIKLEEDSRACFEKLGGEGSGSTAIRLERGAMTNELTKPLAQDENYVVNTPNAVLAVRGTYFRVEAHYAENGDAFTDVYVYGGTVVCRRVMPDGTHVDEEVHVNAGYKARIKMDEVITVYVEERIDEIKDNVDPIIPPTIAEDDLVGMYVASDSGHDMFLTLEEIWDLITDKGIDLDRHRSHYDGKEIRPFDRDGRMEDPREMEEVRGDDDGGNGGRPSGGNSHGRPGQGNSGNNGGSPVSTGAPSEPDAPSENENPNENQDSNENENPDEDEAPANEAPQDNPDGDDHGRPSDGNHRPDGNPNPDRDTPVPVQTTLENIVVTEPDIEITFPETEEPVPETEEPVPETEEAAPETEEATPETEDTDPDNSDTGRRPIGGGGSSSGGGSSDSDDHVHVWETETVPSTCTEKGYIKVVCSSCGDVRSEEEIELADHTRTSVTDPATCLEAGKTTVKCSVCEAALSETEIPANGHTEITQITEPTTDTEGRRLVYCEVCEVIISDEIIPKTDSPESGETSESNDHVHVWETETVPSTCTEKGYIKVVCGTCGDVKSEEEIELADHTRTSVTDPATCLEAGKTTVKCSVCEAVLTETEIPANGHTEITQITEPTTDTEGRRLVYCEVCEAIISDEILPKFALFTEDGDIVISAAGYTIGGGEEIPYTGDYVISQRSYSEQTAANITVAGGAHSILLNGINISGAFAVSSGAEVSLSGGSSDNIISGSDSAVTNDGTLTVTAGVYALSGDNLISNAGELYLNGGTVSGDTCVNGLNITGGAVSLGGAVMKLTAGEYGVLCTGGAFEVTGGSAVLSGGSGDMKSSAAVKVVGGCVLLQNKTLSGTVTNGVDELECNRFDSYPADKLNIISSDGSAYTYSLSESDAIEGVYYIWLIKKPFDGVLYVEDGDITITSSGVTQGSGEEIPYTGSYTIKQRTPDVSAECSFVVQSGVHTILLDGINIYSESDVITVAAGAHAELGGSGTLVTTAQGISSIYNAGTLEISADLTLEADNFGIYNLGTAEINGGTISTAGCSAGISNAEGASVSITAGKVLAAGKPGGIWGYGIHNLGTFAVSGGSVEAQGTGTTDLLNDSTSANTVITGGSFRPVNGEAGVQGSGAVTNGTEKLRLESFTAYPSAADITRWNGVPYDYIVAESDAASDGGWYVWVPVFDGTVYMEDGSVTITETGIAQGTMAAEYAYAGDYVLSQRDSATAVDAAITVESGTHNITLDGVNICATDNIFTVADTAIVTLGGGNENIMDKGETGSVVAIYNKGVLKINGGTYTIGSDTNSMTMYSGIQNSGNVTISDGTFNIAGNMLTGAINNESGTPNIYIEGGKYYLNHKIRCAAGTITISEGSINLSFPSEQALLCHSGDIVICGGSVKSEYGSSDPITNGTDELECVVYDTFPSEAERTFTKSDGTTYVYSLTEADCADDGKYYVWKPKSLGVAVNDVNFPDSVFRAYVSSNFDTDTNGYLSNEEIAAATEIDVSGTSSVDGGVTSLQGVEYFTELATLNCNYNAGLTSLDVSNNIVLRNLNCSNTGITELDVSSNVALTTLDCSNTGIAELDVSKNIALTTLDCFNTAITELDVSNNTALTSLTCYYTDIAELDVSNNTALTTLNCFNTAISELDLSSNTALKTLDCGDTDITELDVSNNTALTILYCGFINITELDVSNNTKLIHLACSYTNITSLDVSKNTALTNLSCSNTGITSLDVSNNTALRNLDCHNSALAYVNITNNASITIFNADGNKYVIPTNAATFDTSTITGFDPTKVSNVANADFDASTRIFSNITGDITYTYDCGQGFSETFTLTRTGAAVFDGTLYTEDGVIYLSERGYKQGDAAEYLSWDGDYVISQRDPNIAVDMEITVESGVHNIILDNININRTSQLYAPINIWSAGTVTLSGIAVMQDEGSCISSAGNVTIVGDDTEFTLNSDFSGIVNSGYFRINEGTIDIISAGNGIDNMDAGVFWVDGGNISVVTNEGWSALANRGGASFRVDGGVLTFSAPNGTDMLNNSGSITFWGGSVKAVNESVTGISQHCVAIPCTDPTTVTIYISLDIIYTNYNVNAAHDDGYAYIWLPVGMYTIISDGITYGVSVTSSGSTLTQQ